MCHSSPDQVDAPRLNSGKGRRIQPFGHDAQMTDGEWAILHPFLPPEAKSGRKRAYSSFIRCNGAINHTTISFQTDAETREEREQHRRLNLAHFADDADCWLSASIEHYDVDNGVSRRGSIFSERV